MYRHYFYFALLVNFICLYDVATNSRAPLLDVVVCSSSGFLDINLQALGSPGGEAAATVEGEQQQGAVHWLEQCTHVSGGQLPTWIPLFLQLRESQPEFSLSA
jgi:hypothetical protein